MKIAICEDELIQMRKMESLIKAVSCNSTIEIAKIGSGEELVKNYENGVRYDLVFMDVRMNKLDGIETTRLIRGYDERVYIVLTTSLIEYAIKGYGVKANDFVLKPVNKERCKEVFERYQDEIRKTTENIYLIHKNDEIIAVDMDDIYYIESIGRKVAINTKDSYHEHYRRISEEEKRLKDLGFVKVHRSYLVNMKNINRIMPTEIILKNDKKVPLVSSKHKEVYDEFTTFMIRGGTR